MTREEALRILELPRAQAEAALLVLWEKAEQWERFKAKGPSAEGPVTPTTPSGMTPVYLKPRARRSRKRPGRKKGHAGAWRRAPVRIDAKHAHRLKRCPECEGPVGPPIRTHRRIIEDLPDISPEITEHTVHGHWCRRCKRIVTPKVSAALPGATLGLRFIVYTAWLHYCLGMSVGNCVKNAAVAHAFGVSPGGLTLAWKRLAGLLEGAYEEIGQAIRESAVLHADETGWRINGVTFWLWAFATKQYCYYLIDRHRGAGVVKQVLGTLFPGVLITDFLGAYNAIEALAKQRCYFHLFTEFILYLSKASHPCDLGSSKSTSTTAPPRGNASVRPSSVCSRIRYGSGNDATSWGIPRPTPAAKRNFINASMSSSTPPLTMPMPSASSNACGAIARRCSLSSTTTRSVPTTTTPNNRCAQPSSPARSVNRTAPRTAPRPTPS